MSYKPLSKDIDLYHQDVPPQYGDVRHQQRYPPQPGFAVPTVQQYDAGPSVPPGQQYQPPPNPIAEILGPPGCPPGLQYLASLEKLQVHQEHELLEMLTGWETENKYSVKNSRGESVFNASEKSKWYQRFFLKSLRAFEINIKDNYQCNVIQLKRKFACTGCLCWCCLQVLRVYAPEDVLIGTVEQCWSLRPYFEVKDEFGSVQMIIKKKFCSVCMCCQNIVYKVFCSDGETRIGEIIKEGNCERYCLSQFSDADHFEINFPLDLDVKMKALLLGACFLIDFMYHENTEQKKK